MTGESAPRVTFPLSDDEVEAYAKLSPALGDTLGSSELNWALETYKSHDGRAVEAQARFKRVAESLNRAVLRSSVVGAAILALGLIQASLKAKPEAWVFSPVIVGLGVFGLLYGAVASACLYQINVGDFFGDWMRSRALAEQKRSDYFHKFATQASKLDADSRGVALDIVNSHLLKDQRRYFDWRGKLHEQAGEKNLGLAAVSAGVASIGVASSGIAGGIATGFAGGGENAWILSLAALASVGAAVTTYANTRESIGQERERARRFRENNEALGELASKFDEIRAAVSSNPGSPEALVTFTDAVNKQLSLELERFLSGGEAIKGAIAKLSQQVEDSKKKADAKTEEGPQAARHAA